VEQAVAGAGGACREVAFFNKTMGNTAQRQIPGNTATGRSSTNNDHIRFNHAYLFFFVLKH
jgi:hypothetical protein